MNNESPKSIKTYLLNEWLYKVFYGFISQWDIFKEWKYFKFYFNCSYKLVSWLLFSLTWEQNYIAKIALFLVKTISYPNILNIFGPILRALAIKEIKYSE